MHIIGNNTVAMAELGGHTVYLNANDLLTNMANVFHEALHNLLGLIDPSAREDECARGKGRKK